MRIEFKRTMREQLHDAVLAAKELDHREIDHIVLTQSEMDQLIEESKGPTSFDPLNNDNVVRIGDHWHFRGYRIDVE